MSESVLEYRVLEQVISTEFDSIEWKTLVMLAGEEPRLDDYYKLLVDYQFFQSGFEVSFDTRFKRFFGVVIFSVGDFGFSNVYEGFEPYTGTLPGGINLLDRRCDVQQKLALQPVETIHEAPPAIVPKEQEKLQDFIKARAKIPKTIVTDCFVLGSFYYIFSFNRQHNEALFRVCISKYIADK